MEAKIALQRRGSCRGFLQNVRRHVDKRRTTFRDVGGRQLPSGTLHHIERPSMRVENPGRSFHNQAVQIRRADGFSKRLSQPVQKIEDQRFLDLNRFFRTLELANPVALPLPGEKPARETRDQQPKKNDWPHAPRAGLLRRRPVVEILFQVIENVFEPGDILRRGIAQRLMRVQHLPGVLLLFFFGRFSDRFALK